MILAGDIGGTSTRLGLFDPGGHPSAAPRRSRVFTTLDFPDLASMITAFLRAESIDRTAIDRACFGVAGPVVDNAAQLTNVPWRVEGARASRAAFGLKHVRVLNDLQAMAYAVPVLEDSELHTLQRGEPVRDGNISADRCRNRTGHRPAAQRGRPAGPVALRERPCRLCRPN